MKITSEWNTETNEYAQILQLDPMNLLPMNTSEIAPVTVLYYQSANSPYYKCININVKKICYYIIDTKKKHVLKTSVDICIFRLPPAMLKITPLKQF